MEVKIGVQNASRELTMDLEDHFGIELPEDFAAIRERLMAEQKAEGGEDAEVDLIIEIPAQIANAGDRFRPGGLFDMASLALDLLGGPLGAARAGNIVLLLVTLLFPLWLALQWTGARPPTTPGLRVRCPAAPPSAAPCDRPTRRRR